MLEHYREFWEQRLDALELYVARRFKASKKRGRMESSAEGRHRVSYGAECRHHAGRI